MAVFAVYALGACRTIYVGDSGELVTAVAVLGIPHPSGYPLYVLLGKLWTLLVPVGSLAFRMSLFSAFCGALACGVLYRLARATGLGTAAAAFSSLLLAFSPTFWAEANVQRVYTLNALFVAWATLLAVRWDAADEDRRRRLFVTTLFVAGLGATNHTFMTVWTIAFVLFAVTTRRDRIEPKLLAAGGAAFAAGLLPYLYLPIRSRQDPVLDWGNPESLGTLVGVVTRRDFWERRFLEGPADLVPIAGDFVSGFGREIGLGGALLAVLGLVGAMRTTRRRLIVLPALVVLGNLAALALHGSRSDIFIWHRYAIPSYVMLAWVAGWGAALVMARLPARAGLLLLAVPAVMLVRGFPDQDRSRYRIAEDFSRTLLEALPPGAHLAASDDNILFVLMYLHLAEDVRPDVDLILQGVGGSSLPPLRFDPDSDPLFFTDHPNWNNAQLELLPAGLAFRVWRRARPAPPGTVPKETLEGELDPRVPKDYLTQNLIGQFHYMLGNTLTRTDWPRARREYAEAMRSAPHNDVLFFNLGLIFGGSGLYDEAIAAFRRSTEINPRPVPGPGRLKASDRIAPLERERRRIAALEADLVGDPRLTGIVPRSPEWHRGMVELLRMRGEPAAARGHALRALEAEARR